jgi:hypothetical protein
MSTFQLLTDPQGEFRVIEGALPEFCHAGWRLLGTVECQHAPTAMTACVALANIIDGRALPHVGETKSIQKRLAVQRAGRVGRTEIEAVIAPIAARELGLETLETRMSDSLDFSEQAVWSIRQALVVAFRAGEAAAKEQA